MTIRARIEERERTFLAPFAALSAESRGRERPEEEHEYRTAFQRDRDRIIHSKAFRRLKRKTQVFLAVERDHYRTRLTHTLEVAQIARTVARALGLNEDLTEAVALGHDLGHTPFGHAGEAVLDEVYGPGFRHYEQSLRVVEVLERTDKGPGLNLTWEVREGILNHSRDKAILLGREHGGSSTLEAQVVSVCDAIAYVSHDIDDALRAGIITVDDLPSSASAVLGRTTSKRLDAMVSGLIRGSEGGRVAIVPEVREATQELRAYLYAEVYPCQAISREITKAKKILRELYAHFLREPLPEEEAARDESLERRTVDLLAGMTDNYALKLYERVFFPAAWEL